MGKGKGGKIFHLALDSTSNGRQKDAIYNHYCSVFGALLVQLCLLPVSVFPTRSPLPTSACNPVHVAAIFQGSVTGGHVLGKFAWFEVLVQSRQAPMCLHADPTIFINSFNFSIGNCQQQNSTSRRYAELHICPMEMLIFWGWGLE